VGRIYNLISDRFEKKKKSLYALAREAGISYSSLWKINRGEVTSMSFDVLENICLNLDCSSGDLLRIDRRDP
jgi:putative transcriptional regulator